MRVKPLPTKTSGSPTNALASLAWRLRIRPRPARINSLYCAEENVRDGESSRTTAGSVVSPDHESPQPANQTFGERLKAMVKKAVPSVFRDKVGFPPPRRWMHDIDVGDAKPLKRFGRPLTPLEHEAIKRFVDEGIKEGVIEPSESPWSSPLLPVPKKDGTTRICVDYRALNTLTKQNAYPLPRIDECYQNLAGAKYFTCLDLRSGYWQVRLTEEAKEKTAFTCRYGHYQFRVMPFGLTNAPATFQSMMNDILREYIDKCAMVYLDDIIIFSKNERDHIENVLAVVRELQNEGLVLNESKCEWGRSSILYLGHIASGDGLRPNPDKVSAILKWPSCSTITEVRGFLNIAGYYRRFIRGFAKEASPLYKLLEGSPRKGSPIQWTEECESAMRRLKKALTSADILIHPTPWHLFVIDTDASGNCIGTVLQQTKDAFEGFARGKAIKEKGEKSSSLFKEKDLRPIAFDSRRMTPTEQRYSAQEREMLAVVYALQKWRGYIEGSPILVRTDHESLKHFLTQKNLGRRLARFADDIAHFNVEIVYRPGKHQLVADALSRRKGHSNVPDLETVQPMFAGPMGPLENSKDHDEVYRTFRDYKNRLEAGEDPNTVGNGSYSLKNDTLQKNAVNRWGEEVTVEVPLTPEAAEEAVKKVHLDLGHLGASAMLTALRIRYNIPFITEIVDKVVRTCDSCQFTKREPTTLQPLHPIPRVEPGDVWALDFIGPLPKTQKGNQYILTAMDLGTDWTIAQAAPHRSREVVVAMLRYVLTTHGKPLRILTDNGEEFTSYLVQNVLRRFGIEHQHTTPYHPQTNGRLEKFNDILTQTLARMTAPQQQNRWDEYLPDALLAHRAHTSSSTRTSPFLLTYGREPRLPSDRTYDVVQRPPTDQEIEYLRQRRLEHLPDLSRFRQEANAKAALRLQKEADRRDEEYREQALGPGTLVKRKHEAGTKLHPKWDGPFVIRAVTDKNVYQLQTRNGYVLRHLYNGERLRPYHPSSNSDTSLWFASSDLKKRDAIVEEQEKRRQERSIASVS